MAQGARVQLSATTMASNSRTLGRVRSQLAQLRLVTALALALHPLGTRGDAPLVAGCRPNYPENLCWESSPLKTRFGSFDLMYTDCNMKPTNPNGNVVVFEGCDVTETCRFAHYRTSMRFKIAKTVKAADGLGPMTADLTTRVGLHAYAKFDRNGKADGFACVKTGPSSVRAGWMTQAGEWLDTTPHDPTTNSSHTEYHFTGDKWYTFAIALSPSRNVQCTITTHTKDVHEEGTDKVVLTTGVRVGNSIQGTFGASAESNNVIFGSIGACPLASTTFKSLSNTESRVEAVHDGRVAKIVRLKELATSSVFLALMLFVIVAAVFLKRYYKSIGMDRQSEDYMMAQLGDDDDGRSSKPRRTFKLRGAGNGQPVQSHSGGHGGGGDAWANRPKLMRVEPRPRAPTLPTEAADDSFESAEGGEAGSPHGENVRFDTATDDDIDDDIEQLFDGVLGGDEAGSASEGEGEGESYFNLSAES